MTHSKKMMILPIEAYIEAGTMSTRWIIE